MIFGVAPGTIDGTLMFNFHFDKLPPTGKWTSDPHELVERDGWLFGNGVVDDGYAFYSFMTALSLIGA
jgi:acetylornithine deacetylase/succinyl-diaminopimelate desuccinylase-like protein